MRSKKPLRQKTALKTNTKLKGRAVPKRQPKPSITKLRKQADVLFSRMVRMRDGELRDGVWWSQCITCDAWKPLSTMHNGHFMSRRYPATRWDEENCNAQCAGCNMFKAGEQYKYGLAVDLKYGDGTAQKLLTLASTSFRVTREYLEEVIHDAEEQIAFYERPTPR